MSCRMHFDRQREVWAEQRERLASWCEHADRTCRWNGTELCRPCFDGFKLWTESEDQRVREGRAACADCQAEQRERERQSQLKETIDPRQGWGKHIALTCKNHPELRWHTKNIDAIGCRSIFFSGWSEGLTECPCPMTDLRVVPTEHPEYDSEGYPIGEVTR